MTGTEIEKSGGRGLSPQALAAARLDALGGSVKDIAEQVGVDQRTVSRWRANQAYLRERDKHLDEAVKELKPAIHSARSLDIKAHNAGVAKLMDLLEAKDADDRPILTVQIQAAIELARLAKGMIDPGSSLAGGDGARAAAGAHATVTVRFEGEDKEPRTITLTEEDYREVED